MAFRLYVNSTTGVTIEPEYSYEENADKVENRYRSRDGSEFVYKWGEYSKWKLPVMYVDETFRTVVNLWWSNNTDLLFKNESSSAVYSVHIVNGDKPVKNVIKPYIDLFRGTINLETY